MVSTSAAQLDGGGAGADMLTVTKQSIVTIVKNVIKTFRNVANIRSGTLGSAGEPVEKLSRFWGHWTLE